MVPFMTYSYRREYQTFIRQIALCPFLVDVARQLVAGPFPSISVPALSTKTFHVVAQTTSRLFLGPGFFSL